MSDTTASPPTRTTGRTLRFPPQLHRRLQRRAFNDRRAMAEVVRDALDAYYLLPVPDTVPPADGVTKGAGSTFRLAPDDWARLADRAALEQRRQADVLRSAVEAYL